MTDFHRAKNIKQVWDCVPYTPHPEGSAKVGKAGPSTRPKEFCWSYPTLDNGWFLFCHVLPIQGHQIGPNGSSDAIFDHLNSSCHFLEKTTRPGGVLTWEFSMWRKISRRSHVPCPGNQPWCGNRSAKSWWRAMPNKRRFTKGRETSNKHHSSCHHMGGSIVMGVPQNGWFMMGKSL